MAKLPLFVLYAAFWLERSPSSLRTEIALLVEEEEEAVLIRSDPKNTKTKSRNRRIRRNIVILPHPRLELVDLGCFVSSVN